MWGKVAYHRSVVSSKLFVQCVYIVDIIADNSIYQDGHVVYNRNLSHNTAYPKSLKKAVLLCCAHCRQLSHKGYGQGSDLRRYPCIIAVYGILYEMQSGHVCKGNLCGSVLF